MPQYITTSAKEVLARVIRGTGYKLPSMYQDDILEWIPEGINYISTTTSLVTKSSGEQGMPGELWSKNHTVGLPLGFVSILAIEDENGMRVPEGGDITDITVQTSVRHVGISVEGEARVTTFNANPFAFQTSDGTPTTKPGATGIPWDGSDITKQSNIPQLATSNRRTYYKIQGNQIQTSFQEGFIRIHYLALPVDNDGYPLIPNNENFKQALEWHVIRRLIGSGYNHKVFNYQYADEQFEKFAGRAMNEISYASLDTRARTWRSTVRLIPPDNFSGDFFINSEQPEDLNK